MNSLKENFALSWRPSSRLFLRAVRMKFLFNSCFSVKKLLFFHCILRKRTDLNSLGTYFTFLLGKTQEKLFGFSAGETFPEVVLVTFCPIVLKSNINHKQ